MHTFYTYTQSQNFKQEKMLQLISEGEARKLAKFVTQRDEFFEDQKRARIDLDTHSANQIFLDLFQEEFIEWYVRYL